jgi:hypothetical protein
MPGLPPRALRFVSLVKKPTSRTTTVTMADRLSQLQEAVDDVG